MPVFGPHWNVIPVGYGHHIPLVWYFNGVQTLASLILHIAIALSVKNCKILAPKPTGMIFQLVPSAGITNFAHCYCLISSKLQNSGPQSPLEWYFNGVQTLALLILHAAIAVRISSKLQNSDHHSPLERYLYGVQHCNCHFFTLPLRYQFKIAKFQPPLPTGRIFHWGPNTGIVDFANAITLWVQHCKIPATIAP